MRSHGIGLAVLLGMMPLLPACMNEDRQATRAGLQGDARIQASSMPDVGEGAVITGKPTDWGRIDASATPMEGVRILARVLRDEGPLPGDDEFLFATVDEQGQLHFSASSSPQPINTPVGYYFASGGYAEECDGGAGPVQDNPGANAVAVQLQAVDTQGRRWDVLGANRPEFALWRHDNARGDVARGDAQLQLYYVDQPVQIRGRCETGSLGFSDVDVHLARGWNLVRMTVLDAGLYGEGGPYLRGTRSEHQAGMPADMRWHLLPMLDSSAVTD